MISHLICLKCRKKLGTSGHYSSGGITYITYYCDGCSLTWSRRKRNLFLPPVRPQKKSCKLLSKASLRRLLE